MYCGTITGQQTRGVACQAAWSSRCTEQICQKCPTNFYSINSSYEPLIWRPDAGTCSSRASCCDIFSRTRPSASEALALFVTGSFFFLGRLFSCPPKKDNILCHQCNFAVRKLATNALLKSKYRPPIHQMAKNIFLKTGRNGQKHKILEGLAASFHL